MPNAWFALGGAPTSLGSLTHDGVHSPTPSVMPLRRNSSNSSDLDLLACVAVDDVVAASARAQDLHRSHEGASTPSLMQQLQHEIDLAFARDQGRGRNTSWYKGDEMPSLACAQRMGIQPMQLVDAVARHLRGDDRAKNAPCVACDLARAPRVG